MHWFIDGGVKNSTDIMVEATAVITIEFICLESCHSSSGDIFFDRDSCWGKLHIFGLSAVETFPQVLVTSWRG